MSSPNSPLDYTSIDLELEAIQRLRLLVPLLCPQCRIWRELDGDDPVLCLDLADCPQALNRNKEEWSAFIFLLAIACHYLGSANSVVFRSGKRIIGWMNFEQIE